MNKQILPKYILPILFILISYSYLVFKNHLVFDEMALARKNVQIINDNRIQVFIFFDKIDENLNQHKQWIIFPLFIYPIFFLLNIIIRKYSIKFIYYLLLISAIIWYVYHYFILTSLETDLNTLTNIYKNKKFLITEGYINVLHKQPSMGHDQGDIILINHKQFIIDHYRISNYGYNTTINKGGVLSEKKYVYVKYISEEINSDNINSIIEIDIPKN